MSVHTDSNTSTLDWPYFLLLSQRKSINQTNESMHKHVPFSSWWTYMKTSFVQHISTVCHPGEDRLPSCCPTNRQLGGMSGPHCQSLISGLVVMVIVVWHSTVEALFQTSCFFSSQNVNIAVFKAIPCPLDADGLLSLVLRSQPSTAVLCTCTVEWLLYFSSVWAFDQQLHKILIL